MYVVTFYSFKGGTGRSMALVNVAAELLLRGRRVLLVDFDLEAPGLDTFPFSVIPSEKLGLVDMIDDYLRGDEVPDVERYVHKTGIKGVDVGNLWLMPAGKQDAFYDMKFRRIDWQRFYDEENGYLFFEDLKAQWEKTFSPDYVLVDSRTGHTDIGGICTRQLPDCVVAMFFPNEQNRRGLAPVIEQIRREELEPRQKRINLQFVMANVPDLDDEDEILADASARCKDVLNYDELAATVHHFNSLSMLEQKLFVIERPKTKLAQEYRVLVEAIVGSNIEDRDGAIAFLDDVWSNLRLDRNSTVMVDLERRLDVIKAKLPRDPDVLRRLAKIRRAQRRIEEALNLYSDLIEAGFQDAEILLAHAELASLSDQKNVALDNLSRLFALPRVASFILSVAARLKVKLDAYDSESLANSPAIMALNGVEISIVVEELQGSRLAMKMAVNILKRWVIEHPGPFERTIIESAYSLALISTGAFKEAIAILTPLVQQDDAQIADIFNYCMATWALTGTPPVEQFRRVLDKHRSDEPKGGNYEQCLSLASWAIGDRDKAHAFFWRSLEKMEKTRTSTFSSWSYLKVPAKRFIDDLYGMKSLLDGLPATPLFMLETEHEGGRLQ